MNKKLNVMGANNTQNFLWVWHLDTFIGMTVV